MRICPWFGHCNRKKGLKNTFVLGYMWPLESGTKTERLWYRWRQLPADCNWRYLLSTSYSSRRKAENERVREGERERERGNPPEMKGAEFPFTEEAQDTRPRSVPAGRTDFNTVKCDCHLAAVVVSMPASDDNLLKTTGQTFHLTLWPTSLIGCKNDWNFIKIDLQTCSSRLNQ